MHCCCACYSAAPAARIGEQEEIGFRCAAQSQVSGLEKRGIFLVSTFSNLKSAVEEEIHLFVGCRLQTFLKSLI